MADYAPEKRLKRLSPDSETTRSEMLNGALNGATILAGGAGLTGMLWSGVTGKEVGRGYKIGGFALGAVGALGGAVLGFRNAQNLADYRTAIATEIGGLEDRIASLEAGKPMSVVAPSGGQFTTMLYPAPVAANQK